MCLAIPGQVIAVEGEGLERQGMVRFGRVERLINLGFTPEAEVGDYVLVHVGLAIGVVDEEQATRTIMLLEEATGPEATR